MIVATFKKRIGKRFVKFYKSKKTFDRALSGYEASGKGYLVDVSLNPNKQEIKNIFEKNKKMNKY